jgi:hypothetical protein
MRQMISGLLAAAALTVAGAAPAMACGYGPCSLPYGYNPYAHNYVGWGFERMPDPELQYHSVERVPQYYYVNQGPTFTGPGAFAPLPTYPVGGLERLHELSALCWSARCLSLAPPLPLAAASLQLLSRPPDPAPLLLITAKADLPSARSRPASGRFAFSNACQAISRSLVAPI